MASQRPRTDCRFRANAVRLRPGRMHAGSARVLGMLFTNENGPNSGSTELDNVKLTAQK
jgi:hypothetical protein